MLNHFIIFLYIFLNNMRNDFKYIISELKNVKINNLYFFVELKNMYCNLKIINICSLFRI